MLIAWFAPSIVAGAGLLNVALGWAMPSEAGQLSAGAASLGWASPVVLHDVVLRDPHGLVIGAAKEIRTERRLARLALAPRGPGVIHVVRPEVQFRLSESSSNIEQLIAALTATPGESKGVATQIVVTDGVVVIHEPERDDAWRLEDVAVTVGVSRGSQPLESLDVSAVVAGQPEAATFEATVENAPLESNEPAGQGRGAQTPGYQIHLDARGVPLAIAQNLAGRYLPGVELAGRLTTRLDATYAGPLDMDALVAALKDGASPSPAASLTGIIELADFSLAADALGEDRVVLAAAQLPLQAEWNHNGLRIAKFDLGCDLGQARLQGDLPLGKFAAGDPWAAVIDAVYQLSGRVDLARLGNMLPGLLRIREGTSLTSGQIDFSLASDGDYLSRVWRATATTSKLTAQSGGREIAWDSPLEASATVRRLNQKDYELQQFSANAEFLKLTGGGNQQNLQASLAFDLTQLTERLGQFFDLGGWQAAGQGSGNLSWRQNDGAFDARAALAINQWRLVTPSRRSWTAPNVNISAAAIGEQTGAELSRLETATVDISAGQDRLAARLIQPVNDPSTEKPLSFQVTVQGELAHGATVADWNLSGELAASARVDWSPEAVAVSQIDLGVRNLRYVRESLSLNEPQVTLSGGARWDRAGSKVETQAASLVSSWRAR